MKRIYVSGEFGISYSVDDGMLLPIPNDVGRELERTITRDFDKDCKVEVSVSVECVEEIKPEKGVLIKTIKPDFSYSQLQGVSGGIDPLYSQYYKHRITQGTFDLTQIPLDDLLKEMFRRVK